MKKIIVSGSIAYDTIISFQDSFTNHLLPDHLDTLSVCFVGDVVEKCSGGTAQNAAYTLGLLGYKDNTILLGSVGKDFIPDAKLQQYISYDYLLQDAAVYTATAIILSDNHGRQITTFCPGAMQSAARQVLPGEGDFLIVLANDISAMIQQLREANERNIPSFFVPGQQITLFSAEQILQAAELATYLVCNAYEFDLFIQKTGLSRDRGIGLFEKVIVTQGARGVELWDTKNEIIIDAVKVPVVADTTGAGDSFVAGLVRSLAQGHDRKTALRWGSTMASFTIEHKGTMKHEPTSTDITARFQQAYS